MGVHTGPLGPAVASWNDLVGTAAADESARRSLYEVAGLDAASWMIVSVDLETSSGRSNLVVYALDRTAHGMSSNADALEVLDQQGELPVTAFELGDGEHSVVASAFERLVVRLVTRGFQDLQLTVQERRSLPEPTPARRTPSA